MKKKSISRRVFTTTAAGLVVAAPTICLAQDPEQEETKTETKKDDPTPFEAPLNRDYGAPDFFTPQWKKPQINRTMAADFVIYAHKDLDKVKMLLEREPGLLNAAIDWGEGDYETALGGASHMGHKHIVRYLLGQGARIDIFCAAMMGMLGTVKEMLTIEPALIDAKGPHGISLHAHAQYGLEDAKPVLDYLQSIKEVELRDLPPFLKNRSTDKQKKQNSDG